MRTNLPSEIIQLIAGHLRETNSPEQEKKFAEWLAVSGNDAEYNKYLKIWKEIAEASADSFDTERAWSELTDDWLKNAEETSSLPVSCGFQPVLQQLQP